MNEPCPTCGLTTSLFHEQHSYTETETDKQVQMCVACGQAELHRPWWKRFFGLLPEWYCDCNAY